eukprot:CAMPEP_0204300136 /NCGR_PEP_ID=MMETSP0468-20130131/78038_1 /ASSEMBLY_ACC=CAM_ASM_000383 /TAXON_ID=2969 /ORGANISM="Oxyrrhis marina" /LENGTH=56 /DNA_ID=CAMNT_0051279169 /DNA_START=290 /DNA_END=460 /DNA_ORIENTATION=-
MGGFCLTCISNWDVSAVPTNGMLQCTPLESGGSESSCLFLTLPGTPGVEFGGTCVG